MPNFVANCLIVIAVLFLPCLVGPAHGQSTSPMELLVLGSGGPGATGRAGSSYVVLIDNVPRILVDAGPGSFARLGEAKLSLSHTDIVLLTHLHIDHAAELPGLFKARVVSSAEPIVFKVWGPGGSPEHGQDAYFPSTRRFMQLLFGTQGAFAYLSRFSAPMTIQAHDVSSNTLQDSAPHVIVTEGTFTISATAGHHGDAPAVIYRVDCEGKSITFSGDIDSKGLADLRKIAKDTDLLVFDSAVLDPPGSPAILYSLHTPPRDIGELANQVHVRGMLLSHLSPATEKSHEAVLNSIRQNFAGPVTWAEDGQRISVNP